MGDDQAAGREHLDIVITRFRIVGDHDRRHDKAVVDRVCPAQQRACGNMVGFCAVRSTGPGLPANTMLFYLAAVKGGVQNGKPVLRNLFLCLRIKTLVKKIWACEDGKISGRIYTMGDEIFEKEKRKEWIRKNRKEDEYVARPAFWLYLESEIF